MDDMSQNTLGVSASVSLLSRCPGCLDAQEQADHQAFMDEMSQALQDAAPNQLVTAGTEGQSL